MMGKGVRLSAKRAPTSEGNSSFYRIINTFWENITAQPAVKFALVVQGLTVSINEKVTDWKRKKKNTTALLLFVRAYLEIAALS